MLQIVKGEEAVVFFLLWPFLALAILKPEFAAEFFREIGKILLLSFICYFVPIFKQLPHRFKIINFDDFGSKLIELVKIVVMLANHYSIFDIECWIFL